MWKDPVRYLFIREPEFDRDGRSTGWETVGLPIKGIYDGYSGVTELELTPSVRLTVDVLRKFACQPPEEYQEDVISEGYGLQGYPNNLKSLVRAAERGWLHLDVPFWRADEDDPETRPVKVSPYMVREEVFQAMILPSSEKLAIGSGRERLEKHESGQVLSVRDALRTREKYSDGGPSISPEADEVIQRAYKSMREYAEHALDPSMSRQWGVIFSRARVKVYEYPVALELTDEEWEQVEADFMDWQVFMWTLRDLNRRLHPAIATEQYDFYANDPCFANEMLAARILQEWAPAITAANKNEEDDDD